MSDSAADAGAILLRAEGLSVVWEGVPAVRDFDLTVRAGEFVGLMGQPGCGKSTALLALLGLTRGACRISGGRVLFDGSDLLSLATAQLASIRGARIGLVTQNPRAALHPMLTVGRQLVNVYRAHHAVSAVEAKHHASRMLQRVGIHDAERRLRSYVHELSTGMAQRVVIAMALAAAPELLIADEPTSGLDVTIQAQILDRLREAAAEVGSAVLLATQDLGIVANYCDRVAIMQAGLIVEDRPVREFFRQPEHDYSRRILALQFDDGDAAGSDGLHGLHGGAEQPTRSAGAADDPAARALPGRAREQPAGAELGPSSVSPTGPARGPETGAAPARAPDAAALLSVRALRKEFVLPGRQLPLVAADDVSFDIARGECVGLVGESGSGKTTVGRCLLRLEESTAGTIRFDGENLLALDVAAMRAVRARMQIVFQDPLDAMNPRWRAAAIIREPLDLVTRLSGDEKAARVAAMMQATGLEAALAMRRPRECSAGVQQRIAVARAMITRPDFIVLDEPTSALTPETTIDLLHLLRDLRQRFNPAYLLISHDLTTIRHLCDRVIVMYLGQIVESGSTAQIFDAPAHPYTRALIEAHLAPTPPEEARQRHAALSGDIAAGRGSETGCYLAPRCGAALERCHREPQALTKLADGRELRCWRAAEGSLPTGPAVRA